MMRRIWLLWERVNQSIERNEQPDTGRENMDASESEVIGGVVVVSECVKMMNFYRHI